MYNEFFLSKVFWINNSLKTVRFSDVLSAILQFIPFKALKAHAAA